MVLKVATYAAQIGDLAAKGIRVVPTLWGSPKWVAKSAVTAPIGSPEARAAWTGFLTAAVYHELAATLQDSAHFRACTVEDDGRRCGAGRLRGRVARRQCAGGQRECSDECVTLHWRSPLANKHVAASRSNCGAL